MVYPVDSYNMNGYEELKKLAYQEKGFEGFVSRQNPFIDYINQVSDNTLAYETNSVEDTALISPDVHSCQNLEGKLQWQENFMQRLIERGEIDNPLDFINYDNGETMMTRYCTHHCPKPCSMGVKKAQELLPLYNREMEQRELEEKDM